MCKLISSKKLFFISLLLPLISYANTPVAYEEPTFATNSGLAFSTSVENGTWLSSATEPITFFTEHPGADEILLTEILLVENTQNSFNTYSYTLMVNGIDRSVDTTYKIEKKYLGIDYQPTLQNPLPQGEVHLLLSVPYNSQKWEQHDSNFLSKELVVYVDSLAPNVTAISPRPGTTLSDPLTSFSFSIDDEGIGIDENTIKIYVDGLDKTATSSYVDGILTYTPANSDELPTGSFDITITASDTLGNSEDTTFTYTLEITVSLDVQAIAVPQSAMAPATIRFSPKIATDNAIQTYAWDFTGDGQIDRSDILGNSYTWSYTQPGDYTVSLTVKDSKDQTKTATTVVHIGNSQPTVSADATPSNGSIPLEVHFSATASDNEGISSYEWDFDGDGIFDYSSTTSANTTHIYNEIGQFSATLRVTDGLGESTLYTLPTTSVNVADPDSPSVAATATPVSGRVPLNVTFGATATDPLNKIFNKWEWDFDGDGTFDYTSTQSPTTSYTYTQAGTHYPVIRTTTEDGRSSSDTIEIQVANIVSISRNLNTIDTALSQVVDITTVTAGTLEMSIIIENRDYQVVHTLVDWTTRISGTYTDQWDGKDVNGEIIREGDYYAVLLYKENGEVTRLDLRNSSGGTRFNPTRNNALRTFYPFDNRPMDITFNINQAAEVTAFIGYSYSNTRVVTFFSRQPMPKGSHNVKWYGTNNEGVLITPPPGKWFMYGNWAYTLANNAVYVKSGAHVGAVTATPPIYTPDAHEADGKPATLKIQFNLTKQANIQLEVFDAKAGVKVATREYADVAEGDQTVEFDGRDDNGIYLHPGVYSLGVRAVDSSGYRSLMEYTVTRIYY